MEEMQDYFIPRGWGWFSAVWNILSAAQVFPRVLKECELDGKLSGMDSWLKVQLHSTTYIHRSIDLQFWANRHRHGCAERCEHSISWDRPRCMPRTKKVFLTHGQRYSLDHTHIVAACVGRFRWGSRTESNKTEQRCPNSDAVHRVENCELRKENSQKLSLLRGKRRRDDHTTYLIC